MSNAKYIGRVAALAVALGIGVGMAPSALADPPDQQRDATADDGSNLTISWKQQPHAAGVTSSYQIENATGPAEGAKRFVYVERTVKDPDGQVLLHIGDAENSVGRRHPLVTISYDSVIVAGNTLEDTGFYVPSGPPS